MTWAQLMAAAVPCSGSQAQLCSVVRRATRVYQRTGRVGQIGAQGTEAGRGWACPLCHGRLPGAAGSAAESSGCGAHPASPSCSSACPPASARPRPWTRHEGGRAQPLGEVMRRWRRRALWAAAASDTAGHLACPLPSPPHLSPFLHLPHSQPSLFRCGANCTCSCRQARSGETWPHCCRPPATRETGAALPAGLPLACGRPAGMLLPGKPHRAVNNAACHCCALSGSCQRISCQHDLDFTLLMLPAAPRAPTS